MNPTFLSHVLTVISCLQIIASFHVAQSAAGALIIDVVEHGAVGDGATDDTIAVRNALSLAHNISTVSTNKVKVLFPWGYTFLSGPFNLTTNITLHVDGTIQSISGYNSPGGSGYVRNTSLWPQIPPLPSYGNSRDGPYLQFQAFVYAANAKHIRITGRGTIDGGGPWWWDQFNSQDRRELLPAGRPNLVQLVNCTDVLIDSITMRDSPFWTVHPVYCTNVHIYRTKIRARMYAPNVDGIDPDSCRNVLIEENDVSVGDDGIAIKAGVCGTSSPNDCRDERFLDGREFASDNITVRNNLFRIGMGIAVGSESSGSIRNVYISNNIVGLCDAGHCNTTCCGWGPALHVKTTPMRGGIIENISFVNNTVLNNTSFIFIEMDYQTGHDDGVPTDYPPTLVRNISFVNNNALGHAIGASFSCAKGDACEDFAVINNTVANAVSGNIWSCHFIKTFTISGNIPIGLEECMRQSMNPTTGPSTIDTQPFVSDPEISYREEMS